MARTAVDARVDLHGLRQQDAHSHLRTFLSRPTLSAQNRAGHHGKGRKVIDRLSELAGERQRGVLRRNVPRWLEEPRQSCCFTQAAAWRRRGHSTCSCARAAGRAAPMRAGNCLPSVGGSEKGLSS